jgi:protein gp37
MSTGIQWTDETWNPIRGCSRVSEGCRNCYAEKVAHRFSGAGMPYEGLTNAQGRWNGAIRVVDEHLTKPLSWKKPRRVFVNSMSDLFHENVADETISLVFAVMALAPQHTFQVLTKRPARMRDYLREMSSDPDAFCFAWARESFEERSGQPADVWPLPNVWLGVSVEDEETADARITLLLQTPAALRFISAEPLLSPVNLNPHLYEDQHLDWVIVGGESGYGARPCHRHWIALVLQQCRQAAVPCFVKQLGAKYADEEDGVGGAAFKTDQRVQADIKSRMYGPLTYLKDLKGGDMAEWPEALRVRQFPEVRA